MAGTVLFDEISANVVFSGHQPWERKISIQFSTSCRWHESKLVCTCIDHASQKWNTCSHQRHKSTTAFELDVKWTFPRHGEHHCEENREKYWFRQKEVTCLYLSNAVNHHRNRPFSSSVFRHNITQKSTQPVSFTLLALLGNALGAVSLNVLKG